MTEPQRQDRPPVLAVAPPVMAALNAEEWADLRRAKQLLETPGLTARVAHAVGRPIERGLKALPSGAAALVQKAARMALFRALSLAVVSLGRRPPKAASLRLHQLLVGASGGVGGAFGFAALPLELPFSTTIMLRSIADIARSEGHEVRRLDVQLSCLEVFALGGRSAGDDAVESSYWAVRALLARSVSEAAAWIAQKGVVEQSAPPLLRLVAAIAAKFGVVISEQMAAKALPIVGAAGGSVVNLLFINHFQDMARGHFIVKRLEARYGMESVRALYRQIALPDRP